MSNNTLSQSQLNYPIVMEGEDRKKIEEAVKTIKEKNLTKAKQEFPSIRDKITSKTGTNIYMHFRTKEVVFNPFLDENINIIEAVLTVSKLLNGPPEIILTLWQIEGLPGSPEKRTLKPNEGWIPFSQITRTNPKTIQEARAWARSHIFFDRFGLDLLIPHKKRGAKDKDNIPTYPSQKEHDEAFTKGYEKEIKKYIPSSPLPYFSITDPSLTPIEIRNIGNLWKYRTRSHYQTTALALQYSVYKNRQDNEVPMKIKNVSLRPVLPFLAYLYYNLGEPEIVVELIINKLPSNKENSNALDLYDVFINTKIPYTVEQKLLNCPKHTCHGYMNALRFEYLRQVYSKVFKEIEL